MRWRVLLFAGLRERAGRDSVDVELDGEASVGELRDEVVRLAPELRDQVFRVAVDASYAADGEQIPEGAEVALIPPVSGG